MSKTCSCGAHFQLHVELAVHRQKTGHEPQSIADAELLQLPARPPSRSWTKAAAVAGIMLMSLLGFTAGMNLTVRTYTIYTNYSPSR